MRRSAALLCLMLLVVPVDPVRAQSPDAETITAIDTASGALHEAFVAKNADSIRALMTPDHLTVTPYYDGPQTVDEIIASLADLDYAETVVGEVSVVLLAPDVAMRTYVADWTGSFKGNPIPSRVFVTNILVNRNSEWLEQFYQVTTMKP